MKKKKQAKKKENLQEHVTLKDTLQTGILEQLKEKQKQLREEEEQKKTAAEQKRKEEQRLREKNKSFEELLNENNMDWKKFK